MGGCQSGKNGPGVEADRRRLSVGAGEGHAQTEDALGVSRGQATAVDSKTLIEMISGTDRKFSIESLTETCKVDFKNKQTHQKGDKFEREGGTGIAGIGYTCRKGLKPDSPNQDSWIVLQVENQFSMYGVFDGHGKKGHDVSNVVKEKLPKMIIKDGRFIKDNCVNTETIEAVCKAAFTRMQEDLVNQMTKKTLDSQLSGTTATLVIHCHKTKTLHFAHVADSTLVLGKKENGTVDGLALTVDHKPEIKVEKMRIEAGGGRVVFDGYANHRVYAKTGKYPGLNMSRCLGDLLAHRDCGVSHDPDVKSHQIKESDKVLLVCSDGVWEFISPQEAVEMVLYASPQNATETAEALAKEAWDRWITNEGGSVVDDITVILIYL